MARSNKKIIFITGGTRSGKSRYAVELASKLGNHVAFVATCVPEDEEMKERIKLHRNERPPAWKTIEEGREVGQCLEALNGTCEVAIVDCLTLFISNLFRAGFSEEQLLKRIKEVAQAALKVKYDVIFVSNEVGYGLVPDNPLGRRFRDILGVANQLIARHADEVFLTVAGIPVRIKPQS